MGGFLPNDYPLLLSTAGNGRWQRGPSPGLVVEAAGVIPVASGRSCQSGQAETPPHANVASQRAYATLARASATWATLAPPSTEPPPEAAPAWSLSTPSPQRPLGWAGGDKRDQEKPVAQTLLSASLWGIFPSRRNL